MQLVYCPKCHTGHYADPEVLAKNAPVACQNCRVRFCICKERFDVHHDTSICEFQTRQRQIEELERIIRPNEVINAPPAKCPSSELRKLSLCNAPLAVPSGTSAAPHSCWAHNANWHRPDCKRWVDVKISLERMRQECPECVRLGRRCDPPPQLIVQRRFDIDQYLVTS